MSLGNLGRKISREVGKGIRKALAPKGVRELPPDWPEDFSEFTKDLWRQCNGDTIVGRAHVKLLMRTSQKMAFVFSGRGLMRKLPLL
ncbi:MAG: hypothetical protein CMM52_01645 [Rhodospirillaceae bacterium]|nr:hypothetical protein [Rhodospirillaceae bacterium]|tara:strand:+ start:14676 stop:14936 length:261 start_codon:yes stop_codon:yes gene_type:complete